MISAGLKYVKEIERDGGVAKLIERGESLMSNAEQRQEVSWCECSPFLQPFHSSKSLRLTFCQMSIEYDAMIDGDTFWLYFFYL